MCIIRTYVYVYVYAREREMKFLNHLPRAPCASRLTPLTLRSPLHQSGHRCEILTTRRDRVLTSADGFHRRLQPVGLAPRRKKFALLRLRRPARLPSAGQHSGTVSTIRYTLVPFTHTISAYNNYRSDVIIIIIIIIAQNQRSKPSPAAIECREYVGDRQLALQRVSVSVPI